MKQIRLKTLEEGMDLIFEVLIQGDTRYYDHWGELDLSKFLLKEAILVYESEIPDIKDKIDHDKISSHRVQGSFKEIARVLLKLSGFENNQIFFERNVSGSIPDLLAKSPDKSIIVECCSCRVTKIIAYFQEEKVEEVWVLTIGAQPWEEERYIKALGGKMQWFIFKRGLNWSTTLQKYKENIEKELSKIHNVGDDLDI